MYRNAYALMFSSVVGAGLGMIYWILAARYYPPVIVGANAAAVSMLTFLAGVAQGPSMNAVLRFIPASGADTKRLVLWAYLFSALFAVLLGVGFLVSVNIWSPALTFLSQDSWLATWFLLGVVGWCIFALQDNVLTGLRETIYVPIENIPYAAVKIVVLVLLVYSFTSYGILASWTVPMLITLVPVNYLIFRVLIPRYVKERKDYRLTYSLRQIIYYTSGNYVAILFQSAVLRLFPVMVTGVAGNSAAAYFYLPWTIATSIRIIVANMSTSFTVELATDSQRLRTASFHFLVHTTAIILPPIIALMVVGPYVLRFSGAKYAEEGTLLLRLLALTALPNIVISLYVCIARVRQKVFDVVVSQFVLCVLTLSTGYVFLGMYGISGVGIAILLSESLVAIGLLATSLWPILGAPIAIEYWKLSTRMRQTTGNITRMMPRRQ